MFTPENGARQKFPNVLVIFTDGKTNHAFEDAANKLHKSGTTVIALGIGKYVKDDQLEAIASPGYYLKVSSFDELAPLAGKLASLSCKSNEIFCIRW